MVEFSKLRLVGFKSFVEPTEFLIDGGMTGVVGPNGCGKSNVVEALRWVMGENSAKRLRGVDMDDVIFSGTSTRPSRNFAEAQLTIKTAGQALGGRFPDTEELVITRRLDRGSGSTFRINGREARAGDIRLLFADIASGAQSASIVAQGKIAALIDAKPTDRRALLEEAAGTTGLASRRREAETRLKASETNLTRVADLVQALNEQRQELDGQSVDAEKYRRLSDKIRHLEALSALVSFVQQSQAVARARDSRTKLSGKVADIQAEVTAMAASAANASAALPALRSQDAEAGAALQRLIVEREGIDREAARVSDAQSENQRAAKQLLQDMEREQILARDSDDALKKLCDEEAHLKEGAAGQALAIDQAARQVETDRAAVTATETQLSELSTQLAKLEAEAASQRRVRADATSRVDRLSQRHDQSRLELTAVDNTLSQGPDLEALTNAVHQASEAIVAARATQQEQARLFEGLSHRERKARDQLRQAQEAHNAIKNERDALAQITQRDTAKNKTASTAGTNLLSSGQITCEAGYELAVAAALGLGASAALEGALSASTPAIWAELGRDAAQAPSDWPAGIEPLQNRVKGPQQCNRLLALCGVAPDFATAEAMQAQLAVGQFLTSKQGGIWRWDGFASLPGGEERAAAERMAQVKRLEALEVQWDSAKNALEAAQNDVNAARSARQAQEPNNNRASQALVQAQRGERDAETALLRAEKDLSGIRAQRDGLVKRVEETLVELEQAKGEVAALPIDDSIERDLPGLTGDIDAAKSALAGQRQALAQATSGLEQLRRDAATREARLGQIFSERHDWKGRQQNAQHFQRSLVERQEALQDAAKKLAAMPAHFAAEKAKVNDAIVDAEQTRKASGDALVVAETRDRERQIALKGLENDANALTAQLAGIEAALEADDARLREIIASVRETFQCGPQGLYEKANVDRDGPLPTKGEVERRLKNRIGERDGLGAVNLRADIERDALVERLETLARETVELEAAISKLRTSIMDINREGRQRLSQAFETVNEAFKECFTKLFGGGKAELKLTEDKDDPLNSGLEIYAQPPGKKVSSLSLMSGGERSLAAIALIFALFRSNPAPICVLDEVDAPLDDHNVGRFVDLVSEMASELGTRFLLITHHAVTMAKMDRLYGVTMGEPGVSNAYSVDLNRAELALAS